MKLYSDATPISHTNRDTLRTQEHARGGNGCRVQLFCREMSQAISEREGKYRGQIASVQ